MVLASCRRFWKATWACRTTLTMLLTPLLLLILLPLRETIGVTKEACNCLYMLLLMAIYWMTEAIPISATALIPTVLLPLMGVMKAADVAKCYQKDTVMLLMGGFLVAAAVESSNVHKRISVFMLRLAGSNMRFLILGFMVPTWFLSMWISNTAATAMMVPIVQAVIEELKKGVNSQTSSNASDSNDEVIVMSDILLSESTANIVTETIESKDGLKMNVGDQQQLRCRKETPPAYSKRQWLKASRALSLSICYASTIGGMATLTGTPTNIILIEILESFSARHNNFDFNLNFFTWMVIGVPLSAALLLLCWLLLQLIFIGFRCSRENSEQGKWIKTIIQEEHAKLQTFSFNEGVVVAHLALLIVLWLSKDPGNVGGWDLLFKTGYVSDATVALLVGLLLFIIPAKRPGFLGGQGEETSRISPKGCLTWKMVQDKVPWGVILLIGGGFALAESIEVSKLSSNISNLLDLFLKDLPSWALIIVTCSVTTVVTQLTSNMTVATLFLPIIGYVAESSHVHPLYLMLPACISTSFAFMLPVSSPTNAIVFASGTLRVSDMVVTGFIMCITGIFMVTGMTITLGNSYFGLDTFPYGTLSNVSSVFPTSPESV